MSTSILPPHLNRLSIKIPLAILALMGLLGVSLYFLVLRTVNDFAAYQVNRDLEEVASQVYDIIDRGYTTLLKTSAADDRVARRLRQVDDQDLIERFASDRHIEVVISHAQTGKLIMHTPGLNKARDLLPLGQAFNKQLTLAGEEYYSRQIIFSPWNWQLTLLKNRTAYAELTHRVKRTYQGAIFVCIMITLLIIFLLQGEFRAPITSIIDRLKENKYPDYQGTQEFTFLSNAITSMMTNLRQQMHERRLEEQQRRELEKKLHQSQKMEAIGLMAGGVAHDLNNILATMVGYPDLLLRRLEGQDPMRPGLQAIKESSERASAIVADLLTVARGAAKTREVVQLNKLILEFLDSPEWQKIKEEYPTLQVHFSPAQEMANISCSPVHIKKSLMNLLINAAEAMGQADSGTCHITTQQQQLDVESAEALQLEDGCYALLTVEDDGPGISEEHISHIFEPFYTRKKMGRSGTGLGLAIIWNAIQDHRGAVTVNSSDQGSSFTLYLPCSTQQLSEKDGAESSLIQGQGQAILIVDDEPYLREVASEMVSSLGYQPFAVASGEEAIAFTRKRKVDLLLLDMIMDPGINGCETYRQILRHSPGQRAIIISGYSKSNDVKQTLQLGASSYIKKPYTMEKLSQVIHQALAD